MSVPFADVPPSTVLLNFGVFGCVVSVVSGFALSSPCIPNCGTDRYLTVGIAAASVIAQVRNRKSHTGIVTKINQHSKISPQALISSTAAILSVFVVVVDLQFRFVMCSNSASFFNIEVIKLNFSSQ